MTELVPDTTRIDRPALERIIRRAAELQAAEKDIGDGISEADLLRLGDDVGIPAAYLQQALVEERTHAVTPVERGFRHWLAGPRYLAAARTIPDDAGTIEEALHHWMTTGELLIVKRRAAQYASWEPRKDFFSAVKRDLKMGGRSYALASAGEIAAQITPLRDGRTHVRLVADLENTRRGHIGGGTVVAVGGVIAAVVGAVLGVAELVAVVPAFLGGIGGFALARARFGRIERVQVAMEQVLDRLEQGEIEVPNNDQQTGPLARIADEVRRNLGL